MEADYGTRFLRFRAKHLLNQTQLANILGISLCMVHRYETNKSKPSKVNEIVFENKMKEWEEKNNVV